MVKKFPKSMTIIIGKPVNLPNTFRGKNVENSINNRPKNA